MNDGRTTEHETQSFEKFTVVSCGTCVGHEISVVMCQMHISF
jgi:hypothetical protein